MDKKFEVKEQTLNAILQYLSKQPYEAVAPLIATLMTECQAQLQPKAVEPKKEE